MSSNARSKINIGMSIPGRCLDCGCAATFEFASLMVSILSAARPFME